MAGLNPATRLSGPMRWSRDRKTRFIRVWTVHGGRASIDLTGESSGWGQPEIRTSATG